MQAGAQLVEQCGVPGAQADGDRTAPGVGPGVGRIAQWATEIEHLTPHKPTVRADAVLQAPDHGLPVLRRFTVRVGLPMHR
ncbi:hypothetical protein [Kitasatospora sp. NPDC058218]|uniref:hypothetical protein n=1 Tax=Kitasatospora sp. NPDC058218 TaxID=3346385 RepID=UPI0036D7F3D0